MDDTVCQSHKKLTDAQLCDIKVILKYFTLI